MGIVDKMPSAAVKIPAAQYLRMSTDRQDYAIANQKAAIRAYAEENDFEVVRTYTDEGKSGLRFEKREGLQALLGDVLCGTADFKAILVYDVSRWGRFQDADESAYYEFSCKRMGIAVRYCAEPFNDPNVPLNAVLKSLKRAMAAEYVRELSEKVFSGQLTLVKLGYYPGGKPLYGTRRLCVDADGNPRKVLGIHERKSYPTDRTRLVLGPVEEQATVRRVFRLFTLEKFTEYEIADTLADEGVAPPIWARWSREVIHRILRNEIYIGNYVYNRTSQKLRTPVVNRSPEEWIRVEGVVNPIVSLGLFRRTQQIYETGLKISNREVLQTLRRIYASNGHISMELIDREDQFMCAAAIALRFGSMSEAYAAAGLKPRFRHQRKERVQLGDGRTLMKAPPKGE